MMTLLSSRPPDAAVPVVEQRHDVGVRLGGVVVAAAVVLVEAVTPLVGQHARVLAGVPAAVSGAEHVDLAAPRRVAGVVDIRVRRDGAVEPGVVGQVGSITRRSKN